MKRLNHHKIENRVQLSLILDELLTLLESSSLEITQKSLAWDTQIPEHILLHLRNYHKHQADDEETQSADFHVVLSNIFFRFPTVRIWEDNEGKLCFEI